MSGASFLSVRAAAQSIAAMLQPTDPILQAEVDASYRAAISRAIIAGELIGQSVVTYLPISINQPGIAVLAATALIRVSELDRWLASLGIPVQLSVSDGKPGSNPQRANETPQDRCMRLRALRDQLKENGVRNFVEVIAQQEGVTTSRIHQDLKYLDRSPSSLEGVTRIWSK